MFSRFFGNKQRQVDDSSDSGDDEEDNQVSLSSSVADDDDDDNDNDTEMDSRTSSSAEKQDNPLLPEEMCDIPTFLNTACCDKGLIEETRRLLEKKYLKRPESFARDDYERMLNDDWTVSRFLLRCRLDPKRTAKLMETCGKFRVEFRMGVSKMSDFPIEFHKSGGLFKYAPDRVGNTTLYMRIKMHRRVPELSHILKEYILCCMEECDKSNGGRGTAVVFDLTGAGIQNVDLSFLFWLTYSFRNYCPKGLSYIIVHNLPWLLNATCRMALVWLSSTNKRRLRFTSGDGIQEFIAPENLPDFLDGTCKLDYRQVPEGSKYAEETAEQHNLTKEQSRKLREAYGKFLKDLEVDIGPGKPGEGEATTNPAGLISSSMLAS